MFCMYDSSGEYFLTIAASNYTLDKLRNANNHWGYRDLEIGGRQALFGYGKPEPDTESCALNIAASTGVYGVLIGTAHHSFAPTRTALTPHARPQRHLSHISLNEVCEKSTEPNRYGRRLILKRRSHATTQRSSHGRRRRRLDQGQS